MYLQDMTPEEKDNFLKKRQENIHKSVYGEPLEKGNHLNHMYIRKEGDKYFYRDPRKEAITKPNELPKDFTASLIEVAKEILKDPLMLKKLQSFYLIEDAQKWIVGEVLKHIHEKNKINEQ